MTTIEGVLGPLSKEQKRAVFNYLFRLSNVQQFRAYFDNGIAMKKLIDTSGYILLNCKLFAWAHSRAVRRGTTKPKAKDYEVDVADARFLRTLDLRKVALKYEAPTLKQFTESINANLCSSLMKTYIGKFVSKKLVFLIRSYGLKRDDINNDLLAGGLYTIYRMFPYFQSELHMVNMAKVGIKRKGQDIISEHTASKKQRLEQQADGTFSSRAVPLHALDVVLTADTSEHFSVDLKQIARIRMTDRARRFLSLLGGIHDPEFSQYLGRANDEAAERMQYERYRVKVQAYMGIAPEKADRFLLKIRSKLDPK